MRGGLAGVGVACAIRGSLSHDVRGSGRSHASFVWRVRVGLDSRELRRGVEPVRLSPKAFQLLEILVTNRPKALSKADLQDRLWPDTFVVEKNLANLVGEIRQALGDTPSSGFIRTVPRYGYAFHGTILEEHAPTFVPPPASARRRAGLALGGVALVVVAAIAAVSLLVTRPRVPANHVGRAAVPEPDRRS